jgi:hypothetical protein
VQSLPAIQTNDIARSIRRCLIDSSDRVFASLYQRLHDHLLIFIIKKDRFKKQTICQASFLLFSFPNQERRTKNDIEKKARPRLFHQPVAPRSQQIKRMKTGKLNLPEEAKRWL